MIIGMFGPHAIGKTTAAERYIQKYKQLTAAIADNQWEATSQGRVRVVAWKGSTEMKERLVKEHEARNSITLVESVRTTPAMYFGPQSPVILVICTAEHMAADLERRCKKNGKPFNAAYWTEEKLSYEASKRYLNFGYKYLNPTQYKVFKVTQWSDWDEIDEYFGKLYRKVHNSRLIIADKSAEAKAAWERKRQREQQ